MGGTYKTYSTDYAKPETKALTENGLTTGVAALQILEIWMNLLHHSRVKTLKTAKRRGGVDKTVFYHDRQSVLSMTKSYISKQKQGETLNWELLKFNEF
jgi:hypothetical protein